MKSGARPNRRIRIDVVGALLVAAGMFLFVFALSEGGIYGWWEPLQSLSIGGATLWSGSSPIVDHARCPRGRRRDLDVLLLLRAGQGAKRRRPLVRVRTPPPQDLPLRTAHRPRPCDGSARLELHPARLLAGREAPLGPAERLVAAADGVVRDRRGADRRTPHPDSGDHGRRTARPRAHMRSVSSSSTTRSRSTSPHGDSCPVWRCTARASASPVRSSRTSSCPRSPRSTRGSPAARTRPFAKSAARSASQ